MVPRESEQLRVRVVMGQPRGANGTAKKNK